MPAAKATPGLRRRVLDDYRAGATSHELAARHRVDATTVQRWIRQAGEIELRRTGPRGRTDVPTALIVELRDVDHLSWSQVADEVRMSKTGVQTRYRLATEGARRDRPRA